MTQYLGICMVVVVVGIVLAVLARLVTGGILDEIERIKKRRFDARCKSIAEAIVGSSKYVDKYVSNIKYTLEMDRELGKEKSKEIADKAFKKTMDEMKDDFIKK